MQRAHFSSTSLLLFSLPLLFFATALCVPPLSAQEAPTNQFLFDEDSERREKIEEKEREGISKREVVDQDEVDFEAPEVEFLQEENVLKGSGGVLVSGRGIQMQAESGQIDLDTNEANLAGNVIMSGPDGTVQADEIDFNLDQETGEFRTSRFTLEEGAFQVEADKARKLSETEYALEDCWLSTCHCEDGSVPWKISSSEVDITHEGYGHAYGATVEMWDTPFVYLPWIAFPVKQERQSGLLVPEFGYSSEDGFLFSLPVFAVIDDSTDVTIRPFGETETRYGAGFDFRKAFSTRSSISGRVIYSNESPRDGDLRGTDISGVFDPSIDEDRFGGFLKQSWSNAASSSVPLSLVSDIHLVSDNLFGREIEDRDIVESNARYASSKLLLSAGLGDYFGATLANEYHQSLLSDQDLVFQRLPEFTLTGSRSFRPFGFNPFGLKVTPGIEVNTVSFHRDEGYDGQRFNISPTLKIPFHFRNFFSSQLKLTYHQTYYELDETVDPRTLTDLDSSTDRGIFKLDYSASTALERIYELPEQSWLKTLTTLGSRNQDARLDRVKHTIEPTVSFGYVPGTDQDDLPVFDSFDRFRQKSVFTYGVKSRLLGSFTSRRGSRTELEETAPGLSQFSYGDVTSPLEDLDGGSFDATEAAINDPFVREAGEKKVRQLAYVSLSQAYDYVEDRKDEDLSRRAFSDVSFSFGMTPTPDFAFTFQSNYDYRDSEFSSWKIGAHLRDDRGDKILARYTFLDDRISQLEANLEIPLTSRFQLGYYTRYDDEDQEFIEQRAALRLKSECDCWHIDFGVSDEVNPDRKRFLLSLAFKGLGDLTERIGFGERQESSG